jgi:hypothetical protein
MWRTRFLEVAKRALADRKPAFLQPRMQVPAQEFMSCAHHWQHTQISIKMISHIGTNNSNLLRGHHPMLIAGNFNSSNLHVTSPPAFCSSE